MKRVWIGVLLALGCVSALKAQTSAARADESSTVDFASTSAVQATLLEPADSTGSYASASATARNLHFSSESFAHAPASGPMLLVSSDNSSVAIPAEPFPAPAPKLLFGDRDDYRWQLGVGFAWQRFQSSFFNASAIGINTSLTYFTNDWFAIDGAVTSTFAPTILQNEHVKLLNYGVGPRIAWRQRRWEPFLHVLFGGAHEQPQGSGSRNSFMLQPGGGVDYRWLPRLSLRAEAAYVRTGFFHEHQNNLLIAGSFIFHF